MKIKYKIIKMLGGYTKDELNLLEDKYKYIYGWNNIAQL